MGQLSLQLDVVIREGNTFKACRGSCDSVAS